MNKVEDYMGIKRAVIKLSGAVQGVGFRPFVYNMALRYGLKGYVLNDGEGLMIEVEGDEKRIKEFIISLNTDKPLLSHISYQSVEFSGVLKNFKKFKIEKSKKTKSKKVFILPDISVCSDCIREMSNPSDRRYMYPFINCTNCGPRFSITEAIPYDRKNTTMKSFSMCPLCEMEYNDPENRRFHAQPNACPKCGPELSLFDKEKNVLAKGQESIKKVVNLILNGEIVAIKGIGGFHLVCDATNDNSVKKLRDRKDRLEKPFAVMFKDLDSLKIYANLKNYEEITLLSPERPIVIVEKKKGTDLSEFVAPQLDRVGAFLPYSPLHHILLNILNRPLVMTSANLSDEPIIKDDEEALDKLPGLADYILSHNRGIKNRVDDSVVFCLDDKRFFIRRARGYVPLPIKLPFRLDKRVLAVGGNQKVSVAFGFDDNIIVSQHIGDLLTVDSQKNFEETIRDFLHLYDFFPDVVVSDMHPDYFSTRWSETFSSKLKIKHMKVQHHHAHALSVMVDNSIRDEKILAVCWDGSGYGLDGNIWGGEFLIADYKSFDRVSHFRNFRLLGSEKAIREPRKVALSLLFDMYSEDAKNLNIPTIRAFSEKELEALYKIWHKGINSPYTSSVGRLFDAVSSLLGIRHFISYEGQSGMIMESLYDKSIKDSYDFTLDGKIVDYRPMIGGILRDRKNTVLAVSKFINTLCIIIIEIAKIYNIPVGISGGVFQNNILVSKLIQESRRNNIKLYFNKNVPPNDGGLASGQIGYTLNL